MKILVVYQYFGTPNGSWSTRIYELTRRWVKEGHEVTVITSPYDKSDIKADGFVSRQNIEGINLIVIDSGDSNRFSKLKRVFRALQFSILSSFYGLKEPADVILCSSGPITVAIPGLLRKLFRGTSFVFEVRDLWPLGGIVMGKIKNNLIQKILLKFERHIYKKADAIVTCSDGQSENIQKRLGFESKLHVIPNASDNKLFGECKELKEEQKKITKGEPYVIHLGSLGYTHYPQYIIDAATFCNVKFILIGDGSERSKLETKVKKRNLSNVAFLGSLPKKETVSWLCNAELSILTTLDNEVQDTCSPNKIFDSFAAGIPIIQTTRGWIHQMVNAYSCGYNVNPQNPKEMAEVITKHLKQPMRIKGEMSENSKKLSIELFNRDMLANKYINIIKKTG